MKAMRVGRLWLGRGILVATLGLLGGCPMDRASSRDAAPAPVAARPPVPVVLAQAQRRAVALRARGIGHVEAVAAVAVKSRVDGQIVAVRIHDGASVRRGQVLFEIDARPARAQLEQARAKLASDQAQYRRAQEQERRYADLLRQKFIAPDAYAQYRTNLDSARANIEADRAAIESARLQVEFATIRSPIDGRAGRIMVPEGNLVKANDANPLVVVNQLAPIYVNFSLPEQYLPQARAALRRGAVAADVTATGDDGSTRHVGATLAFIDNAVDVTTGTVGMRARVPNKDAALWPGQFVQVEVTLGEQPDAVVVPSDAVQMGPDGAYVFVVDDGSHARMRKVRIDRTSGGDAVVAEGLEGGERVVVDGQSRLLPGTAVTVRAAGPHSE